MLTNEELILLLNDLESARIERTQSTKDTIKFSQAVCAFANDIPDTKKPGYLVIGVNDAGRPVGLKVTDDLLKDLAALRTNGNILPIPALAVEKFTLPDGDIAVVEVQPCDMPPVRYKGVVWVRIGPSKAIASEQEERILSEKRRVNARTFDAWPVTNATVSDISTRLFSEYRSMVVSPDIIAENHRSLEEQMASLRFYDTVNKCPTTASILLFGTNPRFFFPCAYMQFLRFPGTTMADIPSDQIEFNGTISAIAEMAKGKFIAYNRTGMRHGDDFRDILIADYPEWSIREFLHNAIMHRDYQSNSPIRFYWFEDRIEIQNAGGFYGRADVNRMPIPNDYRNPILAEGMKVLSFVNRFGFGIQNAQSLLAKNGNPPAEITADRHTVLVTIRKRSL